MKIMQVFTFDVSDKYAYFCDISNILKADHQIQVVLETYKSFICTYYKKKKKKKREKELNEKIGPVMPF